MVERNGERRTLTLDVMDLHKITPNEYIQFGNAVVHNLSYQQARHLNREISGVYVANPGYVLGNAAIPRGSVIVAVDEMSIANTDDLETALSALADQDRAAIRFFTFEDPSSSKLRVIRMDRRWFPVQRCARDDVTGLWPCRGLDSGPAAKPPEAGSARFIKHRERRVREIVPSLVLVNFDMPYTISGVAERNYYGTGLVVDAERGFVIVDRNTVPEAMGDVYITFAGELEVRAQVSYVHPLHNLALLSYDPELIGDTPVRSASLSDRAPLPGETVWVVGLRGDNKLVYQATEVASVDPLSLPLSRTMRFRDTNLETLDLVAGPNDIDGVIVNRSGEVASLWSTFAVPGVGELGQVNKGVPADLAQELLELGRGERELRSLEVEWRQMPLSAARKLGLDEEWVRRLGAHDPDRRQVLTVVRTVAGTPAAELLQPGDLLLSVEGEPATRFREMERAVNKPTVELKILRNKKTVPLNIDTVLLDGRGVRRAMMWAGALLQAPYRDMSAQRGVEPEGVYVSYFAYGSPASRFGLFAGRRIVQVDGVDTPDLDQFLELIRNRSDGSAIRLTTVTWNNVVDVLTLKLDQKYWPAYEIIYDDKRWQRIAVQ